MPILAEHSVNLLDISSGGIDSWQRIIVGEVYQAPFAGAVLMLGTKFLSVLLVDWVVVLLSKKVWKRVKQMLLLLEDSSDEPWTCMEDG